jgi:hypothetical protein
LRGELSCSLLISVPAHPPSVIAHRITTASTSRIVFKCDPPRLCSSAVDRLLSPGDEFPWCNHNHCLPVTNSPDVITITISRWRIPLM